MGFNKHKKNHNNNHNNNKGNQKYSDFFVARCVELLLDTVQSFKKRGMVGPAHGVNFMMENDQLKSHVKKKNAKLQDVIEYISTSKFKPFFRYTTCDKSDSNPDKKIYTGDTLINADVITKIAHRYLNGNERVTEILGITKDGNTGNNHNAKGGFSQAAPAKEYLSPYECDGLWPFLSFVFIGFFAVLIHKTKESIRTYAKASFALCVLFFAGYCINYYFCILQGRRYCSFL